MVLFWGDIILLVILEYRRFANYYININENYFGYFCVRIIFLYSLLFHFTRVPSCRIFPFLLWVGG